tara:strand:+ start:223 stop:690 length:468 start_codon:yes stop_codon:yes gene_type:complete
MKKALFQIENDPVFKGYSDGTKWNGSANPYFDLQTAKMVLAYYQNQDCEESREQWLEWELKPLNIDGKELYSFGYGYCWHELEADNLLSNLLEDWCDIEGETLDCSADEMVYGIAEDDKYGEYKRKFLYSFIDLWDVAEDRDRYALLAGSPRKAN